MFALGFCCRTSARSRQGWHSLQRHPFMLQSDMATIKLKKPGAGTTAPPPQDRPPVRGIGAGAKGARPTLAQAQARRAERDARYQEQLRQRYGDRPPEGHAPRDARSAQPHAQPAGGAARRAPSQPPRAMPARPAPARVDPRSPPRHAPRRDPRSDRSPRGHGEDDRPIDHAEHAPGSLRLSKRMSELGLASRREADEWIAKGYVRVDDQVVSELGSRVMPDQRITIDARAKAQQAQRVSVLVNKPVGYVSGQAEDGYEPALVLVTPANQWRDDRSGVRFLREHLKSLVPAGRLDIDSVGLLVLTQDGRIAKQLIGEDSAIEKEYLVRVAMKDGARLPDSSLALLRHGLELDGEALRPAQVEWVNDDQLRFVLTQGKKRQIRRMCEAVGLQVLGLKRVRIGRVMLGDLPPGQWRYLRADEAFG